MAREADLEVLIKKPTPQDVIAAIFTYSGLKTFTNDRQKIQAFIRENKEGEFTELLKPFVFSEGVDIYPYSRLLESVLAGLVLGGVIFTLSPKNDSFNMEDEMRQKAIAQTEERFSPEDVAILKRLGNRWWGLNQPFSSIGVMMALLVFLPKRFPNNTEVMHRTIHRLKEIEKYKDLLVDFDDFIVYRYPYSSLLERTLNILKGGGIELLSPGFDECIVNDAFVENIRKEVLPRFTKQQQDKLQEIALELENALRPK